MEVLLISVVALIGSNLAFFSGSGLGTILLPVFALFFPIQTAVGLTAFVHLLNNLFKLGLVGKHLDKTILLRFSLPTIPAAFIGSYFLVKLTDFDPLFTYILNGTTYSVEPVKLAYSSESLIWITLNAKHAEVKCE